MAVLEVLRSLSEVKQIPPSAGLGTTMERTQPEAAPGRVRWDTGAVSSLEMPREVREALLSQHSAR